MGARYIHMSPVGYSRGARREQDTYICHMWGILGEQDTYICHMWGILGEQDGSKIHTYVTCGVFQESKMGARYIHMSHVGHSRGARREQDTYICHMWDILGEQDGSKIHTYVTCGAF